MEKNKIYLDICEAYKDSLYRFIDRLYKITTQENLPVVRFIVNAYIDGVLLGIGYKGFYSLSDEHQELVKDEILSIVGMYLMRHSDAESS